MRRLCLAEGIEDWKIQQTIGECVSHNEYSSFVILVAIILEVYIHLSNKLL